METHPNKLDFLKATTDPDRLRIIGALVNKACTIEELVKELDMSFRDVLNHLAFLSMVGLVDKQEDQYHLRTDRLASLSGQVLGETHQAFIPPSTLDEKSRKVLTTYLNPDGSIRFLPHQIAKFMIILRHVIQAFSADAVYSEKEVNAILAQFHEDISGLRRGLVDAGLLKRERDGSRYWCPAREEDVQ